MKIAQYPHQKIGLTLETMNDGVVVFNPATARVHVLNSSAAMVLEQCDGEHSVDMLASAVHAGTAVPLADAVRDVRCILDEFRACGLLES